MSRPGLRIASLAAGLLAFGGLRGISPAFAEPPAGKNWELYWSDEFDGSAVDESKWDYWHDGETRRAALNLAENTYLENGSLVVRIIKNGDQLTAGGLQSKLGFGYGYYEVRAKITGGWATFWMQSPGIDGVGDPAQYGTEMDIQEACCPGAVQHAVHWDGYGGDHKYEVHAIGGLVQSQQEFNVYGLEWSNGEYKFWVNGQLSWTFTKAVSAREDEWIRLTQETDGADCGGPCYYDVDYVRAYKLGDGTGGMAGNGGAGSGGGGSSGTASGGTSGSGGLSSTGGAIGSGGAVSSGGAAQAGSGTAAGTAGSAAIDNGSESSCGCRVPGSKPSGGWLVLAIGIACALGRRRRRGCYSLA